MASVVLRFLGVIIIGYLLGSIPFGLLIGQRAGVDVRRTGSGKTGATNVLRSVGLGAALLVAAGDVAKGAIPVLIAQLILATPSSFGAYANLAPWAAALAGLAAIAGHNYPIYVNFKGGRGVATTGGMALALAFPATLISAVFFAVPIAITRYVSLGSMIGASAVVFAELVFIKLGIVSGDTGWPTFFALLIAAIVIIASHRDNIQRIISGTERKLGEKSPPASPGNPPARPIFPFHVRQRTR
jgi:acyl phosphate:glycerol-3-phosphate acyltransferase